MRLLVDQMFDRTVRDTLLDKRHDVVSVADLRMSTADDASIMQRAITDDRIVLTLDEHFGDWAVLPLSMHPGVIRLKVNPATTANVLELLLPFIARHRNADFRNRLVIVRESGIRWIDTFG